MPSAARERWLDKGDRLNMRKVVKQAHQRNKKPSPGADSTQIWSAEFPINQREFLRAELRRQETDLVLDLRRWFKPSNGAARSTKRGFVLSVQHLPAIEALLCTALTQLGELRQTNGGSL